MVQDLTVSKVLICKPSPEAVCKFQYACMARHKEYQTQYYKQVDKRDIERERASEHLTVYYCTEK